MTKVKIAEFKAHLSKHIRRVQKGAEILVLDREHPVARVIPVRNSEDRVRVRPARVKGGLRGIKLSSLPPLDIDIVKLLREDRDRR